MPSNTHRRKMRSRSGKVSEKDYFAWLRRNNPLPSIWTGRQKLDAGHRRISRMHSPGGFECNIMQIKGKS
jgi:hypothetical protein